MAPQGAILFRLVPCRGKTRIHTSPMFRQRRNSFPVGIVKPQLQRVEIGLLAFKARRFWNRRNALLIKQPSERHLGGAAAMFAADRSSRRNAGSHVKASSMRSTTEPICFDR